MEPDFLVPAVQYPEAAEGFLQTGKVFPMRFG